MGIFRGYCWYLKIYSHVLSCHLWLCRLLKYYGTWYTFIIYDTFTAMRTILQFSVKHVMENTRCLGKFMIFADCHAYLMAQWVHIVNFARPYEDRGTATPTQYNKVECALYRCLRNRGYIIIPH